jgi:6-phosphofructokinase 1
VADKTKYVPREWVNEAGNGVTEEFIKYAKPLIQGREVALPTGIPNFPRLQKHFIEPKLPEYVRTK